MLYHIFYPLSADYPILNVFKYITFRSAYAGITALAISLLVGPGMIRFLKKYEVHEKIRPDGPERHAIKSGTPTMGGILIIFTFLLSTLLWANLSNNYIWMIMAVALGFGLVGYVDDIAKLAVEEGLRTGSRVIDAIGPETFTYRELVAQIGRIIGKPRPIM